MNKIINKFFDEASSLFFIGVLLVSSLALNAQDSEAEVEEIVVKGKVLYSDQVNALKTPVPVLDVPQTVSILQMMTFGNKVLDKLVILLDIRLV